MSFGVRSIRKFGDLGSNEVCFKTHGQASLPGVLIYGEGRGKSWADVQIPLDEFFEAVKYVITNTNLNEAEWADKDDPRVAFVRWVKGLKVGLVHGYRGVRYVQKPEVKK